MMRIPSHGTVYRFFWQFQIMWLDLAYTHPLKLAAGSIVIVFFLASGFFLQPNTTTHDLEYFYSTQSSKAVQYSRFYKSLFKEELYESASFLVHSAEGRGIGNLLRPDLIVSLLRLDHLIQRTFCELVLEAGFQNGSETPRTSNSENAEHFMYNDFCSTRERLNSTNPTSHGLLDIFKDLTSMNSSNSLTIGFPTELPIIDEVLIDIERQNFIPIHMFLGHVRSHPCIRSLSPASLDYFSSFSFPKGLIRPNMFRLDLKNSQIHLDCVYDARAVRLTYKTRRMTPSAGKSLWTQTLSILSNETTRWGPFTVHLKTPETPDTLGMKVHSFISPRFTELHSIFLTILLLFLSCLLLYEVKSQKTLKVFCFTLSLVCAILSLISGLGIFSYFNALQASSVALSGCVIIFVILFTDIVYAFYRKVLKFNIIVVFHLLFISWESNPVVYDFCTSCILSLVMNTILWFTFFLPLLLRRCKSHTQRGRSSQALHEMRLTPSQFFNLNYPSFRDTLLCLRNFLRNKDTAITPRTMNYKTEGYNSVWDSQISLSLTNFLEMDSLWQKHPFIKCFSFFYSHRVAGIVLILICFGIFLTAITYGVIHSEVGWKTEDLLSFYSSNKAFDKTASFYFNYYGEPTFVALISQATPWWSPLFYQRLQDFEANLIRENLALKVINPLSLIAADRSYMTWLTGDHPAVFENVLRDALSASNQLYHRFQDFFIWKGSHLVAWKMMILPPFQTSAIQQHNWFKSLKAACRLSLKNPKKRYHGSGFNITHLSRDGPEQVNHLSMPPLNTFIIPWNPYISFHEFNTNLTSFVLKGILFVILQCLDVLGWGPTDVTLVSSLLCFLLLAVTSLYAVMQLVRLPFNFITLSWGFFTVSLSTTYITQTFQVLNPFARPLYIDKILLYVVFLYALPSFHVTFNGLIAFCFLCLSESYLLATFSNTFVLGLTVTLFCEIICLLLLPIVVTFTNPTSPQTESFGSL